MDEDIVYIINNLDGVINYGSMMAMRIIKVYPDITDNCMRLPIAILKKPNADFDGDIMSIEIHKLTDIGEEIYKKMNPRDNFQISRNDGMFDPDSCLARDQIVGVYGFLNI